MHSAEISRVADHELVFETPRPSEWIFMCWYGREGVIVHPIVDDLDPFLFDVKGGDPFRHCGGDDDIAIGSPQRTIAETLDDLGHDRPEKRRPHCKRHFGVKILQPIYHAAAL